MRYVRPSPKPPKFRLFVAILRVGEASGRSCGYVACPSNHACNQLPSRFLLLEYAPTSLPIDPMPLLAFTIASFSRPRPEAMELVDLRPIVSSPIQACFARICLLKAENSCNQLKFDEKPAGRMPRAQRVREFGLDNRSGPHINGGYSDYGQSAAHRTRTLFRACKGAGGVVWVCVELEAKAKSLGPKAMNCTFWLLLPARCTTPPFCSTEAASCIAFAALDPFEP